METKNKTPTSPKNDSERAQRMAKALRENLLKRKQQQRARQNTPDENQTKS